MGWTVRGCVASRAGTQRSDERLGEELGRWWRPVPVDHEGRADR